MVTSAPDGCGKGWGAMEREGYMCECHQVRCYKWCQLCIKDYASLPDVATMTPQERAYEVCVWLFEKDQHTIPVEYRYNRFALLVGRRVFNLEMCFAKERLILEALGQRKAPQFVDEITCLLPERLQGNVRVVDSNDDGSREFSPN